jgi:hypothetical protein
MSTKIDILHTEIYGTFYFRMNLYLPLCQRTVCASKTLTECNIAGGVLGVGIDHGE